MTTTEQAGAAPTAIHIEERSLVEVLDGIGPYTVAYNDPPWSRIADRVRPPSSAVEAWEMDLAHLERLARDTTMAPTVVGVGGGTALDTAKFLAWKHEARLVQVPTITSVDAGFTDAIGVRVDGKVRYIGRIMPDHVVLDIPLVQTAPRRLNRAGVGDILSCHTGLHDWRAARAAGREDRWSDDLVTLGETLLADLEAVAPEIRAVSAEGVRHLAHAYRSIGAACATARHSRFEEGSEHFWAYCYEQRTGAHQLHGELIAFAVVAMSAVQDNDPEWAASVVARAGVRAHPADLGITRDQFAESLIGLREYARAEGLDISIADLRDLSAADVAAGWDAANALPRVAAE
jgi:glycerol dehydrogenase-like iron-containing ADH family enzyme